MPELPTEALAACLEQDPDALWAAMRPAIGADPGMPLPPDVHAWFQELIGIWRGQPDHTPAWVARLVEVARADGHGPDRVTVLLQALRRALIARLAPGALGALAQCYEALLEVEDRYAACLAQYRAQTEREALASERRRLRVFAETLDQPFVALDAEGEIIFANTLLARTLGLPPEALAGREMAAYCDAETAAELRRCIRQRRSNTGRQFAGALCNAHRTGIRHRFKVRPMFDAHGLRDGIAVVMEPFEIQGEPLSAYLQGVFDQIAETIRAGLQLLDADRGILYENSMCRALLESLGATGQPLCCYLLHGFTSREHCVCREVLATGETFGDEVQVHEEDSLRWYNVVVLPLRDQDGRITRTACVLRDITAMKQLENRLLLQQRSSLVSQVAVSVAHQLRNPLGVMLGFAEMLQSGLAPDKLPMVADRLLRNALRCKEIVEDVLEFGHGLPGERAPVELATLLRDLVQPMYLTPRSETIEWHVPETLGVVECVPGQLVQVVASLLDNALTACRQSVLVEAWREGAWLHVRVQDDGPGVPAEIQSRIFMPFFTTRKEAGAVGLGLSLSQSVISEYGGQIFLESPAQSGASFLVRLPAAREAGAVTRESPDRPRVLVVDDELDLLDMLGTALELKGFIVDMAGTATEAMALLDKQRYQAAVFDVQLPGVIGGAQLYEHVLRRQPALADSTLFITADTMNFETQRFLERVGRPSMEKPFLVSDFTARMEQVVADSGRQSNAGIVVETTKSTR